MTVFGLFSGIGGLELGFHLEGFAPTEMCELDASCRAVLKSHFPHTTVHNDILNLRHIPAVDVLLAGFPCKPFSQAGPTSGLKDSRHLLAAMFEIIAKSPRPMHIVLENVPNIVHLRRGEALAYITSRLDALGYRWAYRMVDAIEFGLPQRRRRWILVASFDEAVPSRLFIHRPRHVASKTGDAYGFYWTEGNRGLGWAKDAIPPLKAGSGISIPSAPAIWDRANRRILTPDIRDAERLQGFDTDWTASAGPAAQEQRQRWQMVGNAVNVPVARYVARLISATGTEDIALGGRFGKDGPWPNAAVGRKGHRREVHHTVEQHSPATPILAFLKYTNRTLSYRATKGFRMRLEASSLQYPPQFLLDLKHHERLMLNTSETR